jgi:hypothetical protein
MWDKEYIIFFMGIRIIVILITIIIWIVRIIIIYIYIHIQQIVPVTFFQQNPSPIFTIPFGS